MLRIDFGTVCVRILGVGFVIAAGRMLAGPTFAESPSERSAEAAVSNLDIGPGLEAGLFAAEPMLANPANIDVDHLGRVWVCEVLNYRKFRNKNIPAERVRDGDRILILEDVDADGVADSVREFYRGQDVDSAHGICVLPTADGLGTRVVISCGAEVFVLTDDDGDLKADRKEVLFSKIKGVEHDHGIHAFVFGPDGRMYFNFGNAGKELSDRDGQPVVDMAGNRVHAARQPYQEGMVFRCEADGTQFETLAWNFRNNWEVCVDSFGTLWQSDNDDDGNRGVRINFVMEYGNYGYRDEVTGAGWNTNRTGMHPDVPQRHWHLNDPGVVPNLLQTGGGSPTGILCYEGSLLPDAYRNQLVHCDAGPNVVRAYAVEPDGAGYAATVLPVVHGPRDQWFRPSDVCVAPDGSLIVADWYDPGVGGHAMGDVERGRLFRVAPPGASYEIPPIDVDTVASSIDALKSPNLATRYLAYTALREFDAQAATALVDVVENEPNSRFRARALWLLARLNDRAGAMKHINRYLADDDLNLRITALRAARMRCRGEQQTTSARAAETAADESPSRQAELAALVRRIVNDRSPQVRREAAIALRHLDVADKPELWATLAAHHDGRDRWYLEALGIAAEGDWDACLAAWREAADDWKTVAGRDIVWRSRAADTPSLLSELIVDPATPPAELPRLFRGFDLLDLEGEAAALLEILHAEPEAGERGHFVIAEALARIGPDDLTHRSHRTAVAEAVARIRGQQRFPRLATRFGLEALYPEIVAEAIEHADQPRGLDALNALLATDQRQAIVAKLQSDEPSEVIRLLELLETTAAGGLADTLLSIIYDERRDLATRAQAVAALGAAVPGAQQLVKLAESERLDEALLPAVAATLHTSGSAEIRQVAATMFPLPPAKDNQPLPAVDQLIQMNGDQENGRQVFLKTGTCATCHKVGDDGQDVGPALTEIGSKLSREAMFQSLLFPSAGISHGFETYTVLTVDGNVWTGVLRSDADQEVILIDAKAVSRAVPRDQIDRIEKQTVSLMPADLHQSLTPQQLVDVVAYMQTLQRK